MKSPETLPIGPFVRWRRRQAFPIRRGEAKYGDDAVEIAGIEWGEGRISAHSNRAEPEAID